ncbi:MAG: radical SAM protein [Oligoflexia bacterium]|nr:radical SAM protein [Oligoflexia bacterium]
MNKPCILLCSLAIQQDYILTKHYYSLPNLGLGYLAAALGQQEYEVKISSNVTNGKDIASIAIKLLNERPHVIGFYALSESFNCVMRIAKLIKESNHKIFILVGGPHVTALPESLAPFPWIDYAFRGEAEESLPLLLKNIFSNDHLHLSQIPGLIYRNLGKICYGDMAMVKNLDKLKMPARELFGNLSHYRPSLLAYKKLPATGMLTARGCSNRCVFCQSGKGDYPLRLHSSQYVIEEMSYLKQNHAIRELIIFDDTFLVHEARAVAICEEMIRKKLNFSWSCNARVNNVNGPLLKLMKRAGCWLIQYGIESGNQEILNNCNKKIDLKKVEAACALAYKHGLYVKGYFIFGLPGETKATLKETTHFMQKLPIHYAAINFLTPFPGTPMWDICDEHGYFDKSDYDKINYLSDTPPFIPKGMSVSDLTQAQRKAYIKFYLNPLTILRNLIKINTLEDIKKLANGFMLIWKLFSSKLLEKQT